MPSTREQHPDGFTDWVDLAIVGAGAAGLTAALAAAESGATVMVFERDGFPAGSTSLSAGLIPAAGTRWQSAESIADSAEDFATDIIRKSQCESDRPMALRLAATSAIALHWLADRCQIPLSLVGGFTYPGHRVRRMHGTPSRTGSELLSYLLAACDRVGVDIVTDAYVNELCFYDGVVSGIGCAHGGQVERLGAGSVILACNGYGGNRDLVKRYVPEIRDALYFGHAGNTGDAVIWAQQIGAAIGHMSAYQGHGSVARPHGILITWAVMMEGGFQVNQLGERFSNEHAGYSEQAVHLLGQPGRIAWNIFDQRIFDIAAQFEDFREAARLGALVYADNIEILARKTGLPVDRLLRTLAECEQFAVDGAVDRFGRSFDPKKVLQAPFYAVRVEAALFHTQGGLVVDQHARAVGAHGDVIPGLYAVGGAAQGVSGDSVQGYLSGNGLLTAVTFGFLAGRHVGSGRAAV